MDPEGVVTRLLEEGYDAGYLLSLYDDLITIQEQHINIEDLHPELTAEQNCKRAQDIIRIQQLSRKVGRQIGTMTRGRRGKK